MILMQSLEQNLLPKKFGKFREYELEISRGVETSATLKQVHAERKVDALVKD